MSEQQKPKQKSLSERVSDYFLMRAALEKKYEALLAEVAEIHDPNAKVQAYSGFSYIAPALINDEAATIAQFLLENKESEKDWMLLTDMKNECKSAELEIVKKAMVWHTENGLEMPKKPRKGYLKLNKRGMMTDE